MIILIDKTTFNECKDAYNRIVREVKEERKGNSLTFITNLKELGIKLKAVEKQIDNNG